MEACQTLNCVTRVTPSRKLVFLDDDDGSGDTTGVRVDKSKKP